MMKKYWIILLIVLIIVFALAGFIYLFDFFKLRSRYECNDVLEYIDSNILKTGEYTRIPSYLENPISTICSYSVLEEYAPENYTDINISDCDTAKIKNGLENPSALNMNEIKAYFKASNIYGVKGGYLKLKDVYIGEFSSDCNRVSFASSYLYTLFYQYNQGLVVLSHQLGVCYGGFAQEQNFTQDEMKECMISLLDAIESTTNYYLNFDYSGNVQQCLEKIDSIIEIAMDAMEYMEEYGEIVKNKLLLSELFNTTSKEVLCQELIYYRKKLVEKVGQNDLDYNQKYLILTTLILQEDYIGNPIDSLKIFRDLVDRIPDPKYKALIDYSFSKTWDTW